MQAGSDVATWPAPGQQGRWRSPMAERHVARTRLWVTCALPRRLCHARALGGLLRSSGPRLREHANARPPRVPALGPRHPRGFRGPRSLCRPLRGRHASPRPGPCKSAPPSGPRCVSRPMTGRHVAPSRSTASPMHPNPLKTSECPFLGIWSEKSTGK